MSKDPLYPYINRNGRAFNENGWPLIVAGMTRAMMVIFTVCAGASL